MLSLLIVLSVRNPVGVILRSEITADQEHNVHDPPDAEAAKGQKLADACSSMAEAKPVEADEPQEHGVQQGSEEVMVGITDARVTVAEKCPVAATLDAIQRTTANFGLLHFLPTLASEIQAAVAKSLQGSLVIPVINRFVANDKRFG